MMPKQVRLITKPGPGIRKKLTIMAIYYAHTHFYNVPVYMKTDQRIILGIVIIN